MSKQATQGPLTVGCPNGLTGPTTPRIGGPCCDYQLPFEVVTKGDVTVAIFPKQESGGGDFEANARMFAHAGEVLDMLRRYVEYEEQAAPASSSPMREQARAIIAKAVRKE